MMNDEYIPAPSRNATRFVVHTPRIRIIDMSTSGSRLWTSTQIQAAITTAPAASSAIVLVPPQPHTVVCAIAISTQQIPMLISAAASQFTWPGDADRRLGHVAPRGERGQQRDHERRPEQPVPAQVLDDDGAEHQAGAAADPEDR